MDPTLIIALVGVVLSVGTSVVLIGVAWGKVAVRLRSLEKWKIQCKANHKEHYEDHEEHGQDLATLKERTKNL